MAARKFKFVSPGVFLKEIDNSQLPKIPENTGPVIIGRARKGPAMKAVRVNSYQDFVDIFGTPVPGGQGDDVWREGNGLLAPAYSHYAAKAYFAADIQSPVTMIRLLGVRGDNASDAGQVGWDAAATYGLFTYKSGSSLTDATQTHELAAVFYATDADVKIGLNGKAASDDAATDTTDASADGTAIKTGSASTFTVRASSGSSEIDYEINFTEGSKSFIRKVLPTNPVATNSNVASVSAGVDGKFWLGETFENNVASDINGGYILKLGSGSFQNFSSEATAARTGWVVSQNTGSLTAFKVEDQQKLFRLIAVNEGEQASKEFSIAIEDIRQPEDGDTDPYGSFSVVVRKNFGGRLEVIESFTGCNLNPNSQNYVARQIGDQFLQWSATEKRNKVYGNYTNRSTNIRVDMNAEVDQGLIDPSLIPFGYLGTIRPKRLSKTQSSGTGFAFPDSKLVDDAAQIRKIFTASNTTITLSVPGPKLVQNAAVDGSDHFGAAIYKVSSTGNLSSRIDPSVVDAVRRLEDDLAAKQESGIVASGDDVEHSSLFSLDDVVLTGDNLDSQTEANVKSATHTSGSGNGPGAASQAVLKFTTATDSDLDGGIAIKLKSADGTEITYQFNNGGGQANGDLVSAGVVRVNVATGSGSGQAKFSSQFKAAVEGSNGHQGKLTVTISTATVTNDTCTITQVVAGPTGDTAIDAPTNPDATKFTVNGGIIATTFSGGGVGASFAALSGSQQLLRLGFNQFQMTMDGGFDGVDIREPDPFANRILSAGTVQSSYAYASVDRAIQLISDPESTEFNIAVMPGITADGLTAKLIETCEARADALAIIDLKDVYKPPHEYKCTGSVSERIGTSPVKAAKDLKARGINSSYGATYYPWVKIADTENTRELWVPPSVIALGVMAYTEEAEEVWFAPAGFNRGGLNEGNAGLPVLQASEQLLSKQRDTLYEANINPIASFVTEGLVIFGQKTLQTTPSALDRINVRRLLIFVKKEVSRIANGLLFDQNLPATWNRFRGQVVPFLQSVKTRLGLSDFKVILDETTTTPDLIDRNVMYAKIFLKPARAIEFIAVDFVITNTGASFDD